MSTQFSTGPTRNVQRGDTPDLDDGQLSRSAAVDNILRGEACFVKSGVVTVGVVADALAGYAAFVPIQSVDNTGGGLPINGVSAPQRVALEAEEASTALTPDDYVKISATAGQVELWVAATDDQRLKYARYLGKEAGLLDRDPNTPFDETLTVGVVPDQTLTPVSGDNTGWFQLLESQGGVEGV